MTRKMLIVGGVAGGASAAARLRRLSEDDQIIMFEKGPHVSFSNCCLPYHLDGTIKKAQSLVLMDPDDFLRSYNIEARTNCEVTQIDREAKRVRVLNHLSGESYWESYDKLVLSPGARPLLPPIPGIEQAPVFTVRNVVDIERLQNFIVGNKISQACVIGGGYVGIECAENLRHANVQVSLVEALPQVLRQFDYDMVQILHRELHDKGVRLILNDRAAEFEQNRLVLESGAQVEAQVFIMAIGVQPEVELARDAGLKIGKTGAMAVDSNCRTLDPDIYAVGDVVEVFNPLLDDVTRLPLAGPAQKQARWAADHIHGRQAPNRGHIGSSVIRVFDYTAASTGLNESLIKEAGLDLEYEVVNAPPNDIVYIMPGSGYISFKLIFEKPSGRILGAQAIGKGNVEKRIDVIATAIKFGGTVDDLWDLELCYAPPYSTAKDAVNHMGYVASNLLRGDFKQVQASAVRGLVESGAYILDVREPGELRKGRIEGGVNIPMSELRQRTDEIPRDRDVYVHCRGGQRSYYVCLTLQHLGFERVYNVAGGYLAICFYEYFNDQMSGRQPIVTGYNFA